MVAIQCSRSASLEFGKLAGLGTMIEAITGDSPHEVAVVSYGDEPTLLGDFSIVPTPCNSTYQSYESVLTMGRPLLTPSTSRPACSKIDTITIGAPSSS